MRRSQKSNDRPQISNTITNKLGYTGSTGLGGTDFGCGAGTDIGSIIGNIATGGVGGGVLMAIIGLIKKAFKK